MDRSRINIVIFPICFGGPERGHLMSALDQPKGPRKSDIAMLIYFSSRLLIDLRTVALDLLQTSRQFPIQGNLASNRIQLTIATQYEGAISISGYLLEEPVLKSERQGMLWAPRRPLYLDNQSARKFFRNGSAASITRSPSNIGCSPALSVGTPQLASPNYQNCLYQPGEVDR